MNQWANKPNLTIGDIRKSMATAIQTSNLNGTQKTKLHESMLHNEITAMDYYVHQHPREKSNEINDLWTKIRNQNKDDADDSMDSNGTNSMFNNDANFQSPAVDMNDTMEDSSNSNLMFIDNNDDNIQSPAVLFVPDEEERVIFRDDLFFSQSILIKPFQISSIIVSIPKSEKITLSRIFINESVQNIPPPKRLTSTQNNYKAMAGDWNCKRCNNTNFKWRKFCKRCHYLK